MLMMMIDYIDGNDERAVIMMSDCDDGLDVGLMVDNSNVEYMKFTAVKFMVVCVVVNK
jgi:hypothetical protein